MKITVITVCYNSVKTIEKTIQSVLSQRYHHLEYIIIDGGSTDGTQNIIDKYRKDIAVYIIEPDKGIYDAMNKGIKNASGDIVAFLNSDDWYMEEADVFNSVEKYFCHNKVDIVSGGICVCRDEASSRVPRIKLTKENIFVDIVCPHPAMFVKRGVYERLGAFDISYKIAADTKWIINAYMNGIDILCVVDYFTYFSEGGISTTKRYAALEEQYNAARCCALENHLIQMEEKIEKYYTAKLKEMEKEKNLETALEENQDMVKELFDYHKKYYIWGAGIRGRQCLRIFEKLEIPVAGFIDSNKRQETINGYKVIKPNEVDRESHICITPKNYEDEIKMQLHYIGIEENRFFSYSNMLEKMADIGSLDKKQ